LIFHKYFKEKYSYVSCAYLYAILTIGVDEESGIALFFTELLGVKVDFPNTGLSMRRNVRVVLNGGGTEPHGSGG